MWANVKLSNMPEKLNIVFNAKTLQEFKNSIRELATKYIQMLKQPAQEEDKLLFMDVPTIEIRPKSISENPKKEENGPKNIGIFTNLAKDKEPKMVEDGGTLR